MSQRGDGGAGRSTPVTIAEVARHAGVAVSTVSYVLSGKRAISPKTTERVMASITELGYHPHAGARALASRRSNVLAVMLPLRSGMHLPVLMQFATGVVTSARRHDHDVLLMTADEGPAGVRRVAASAMVDGMILMDVEVDDERVSLLRELDLPSVLIGFPADAAGLTCVDLDFAAAGAECARHLADRGRTDIALLGAPAVVYERRTGFAERTKAGFLAEADRRGLFAQVLPCEDDGPSVRQTVKELLVARPDLDGLVVHNEAAVGHVLHALEREGRRAGRNVDVVAICPDEVAERTSPPLSSVLVPAEELAANAVHLLMEKLAGHKVPEGTLLSPRLTLRP